MVLPKNNRPHTNSSCGACCFYEESGVKVYRRGPLSGGRTFLFSKGLPLPSGFARCLAFLCFRGDGTIRLRPDGDNAGYSGSCGGNRRVCPELRNENLPDGHEQHGERGACDEAVHAEKDESPQRGQQHGFSGNRFGSAPLCAETTVKDNEDQRHGTKRLRHGIIVEPDM